MKPRLRWKLLIYDFAVYLFSALLILIIYPRSIDHLTLNLVAAHMVAGFLCIYVLRLIFKVYEQIWRYAGPSEYMRLILADGFACLIFLAIRRVFPETMTFVRAVSLFMASLLGCIVMRLMYQWVYLHRSSKSWLERASLTVLRLLTGTTFGEENISSNRIKIAIVGAGSVGAMLAA